MIAGIADGADDVDEAAWLDADNADGADDGLARRHGGTGASASGVADAADGVDDADDVDTDATVPLGMIFCIFCGSFPCPVDNDLLEEFVAFFRIDEGGG